MSIRQTLPASRQLDLLGGAHAMTVDVHRLFFALMPDQATRTRLAQVAATLRAEHPALRARWVTPDRYHVTLHFLGDHPTLRPDIVAAATRAAAGIRATPFEWTLDRALSFRGREPPCVLRNAEHSAPLQQLWQALGHALALAGQATSREREFTPHVTLAYGRSALPQALAVEPVPWPVQEFALIRHVLGQGAYQLLGRWPLAEA